MQKENVDFTKEFKTEVERQVAHLTIKCDYLKYKIAEVLVDESAEVRGQAKIELDALNKTLAELTSMMTWLNKVCE